MKMQPGRTYFFDHPTLDKYSFIDGWLYRDGKAIGAMGKNNGSRRGFYTDGLIEFFGHQQDIPSNWRKSIYVSGMIATLPDEQEVAIYEYGSERPSTREKKLQQAAQYETTFRDKALSVVSRIKEYLGDAENPEAMSRFSEMLHAFTHRAERDHFLPVVSGFLLGLHSASIINLEQLSEMRALVNELRDLGIICSDFSTQM